MKNYLLIFICLLFSCLDTGTQPKNIINESKLINIIVDIQLAEAAIENNSNQDTKIADSQLNNIYLVICKKHQTSPEKFKASIIYYSKNHEKIEQIYSKALEQLNIERSKFDQQ